MTSYRLESFIQNYAWGSHWAIAKLLGRAESGAPEAELWLGAHERSPSRLKDVPGEPALDEWIRKNPSAVLGEAVARRFSARLPFLFKVLAAEQPLSLQAHPSLTQAREGFRREEADGIALDAKTRNYKDENHKPELICALTPFHALCGFRPAQEALEVLRVFGIAETNSPLLAAWQTLESSPNAAGIRGFFLSVFDLSVAERKNVIDEAVGRATELSSSAQLLVGEMPAWLRRLARLYPEDPGVILALLLNLVVLEPGQALYLPAGNVHAYLEGSGLELMASSDNVLRGGLTTKHVDVAELSHIVDFSPSQPPLIEPRVRELACGAEERVYDSPAPEFQLLFVDLELGTSWSSEGPALLLVLRGELELTCSGDVKPLKLGDQVFCSAQPDFFLSGSGQVAVARLNPRR